jgi:MFS family permease
VVEAERIASRMSGRELSSSRRVTTLSQGLRDRRFLLVFAVSAFMPVYLIYLVLNVKLIYMPFINDDHFLSYCSALVTVSAVVGAPLWGYIADAYGFRTTLTAIVAFDCMVKLFGIFCV